VPPVVLVPVDAAVTRATAVAVDERLLSRGIATVVAPRADKFGKQIRYADRRRIPYVWFGAPPHSEVKDIRTGEQLPADPDRWEPDAADLRPTVSGPA
jgi:histidyl-tRNA synthetase